MTTESTPDAVAALEEMLGFYLGRFKARLEREGGAEPSSIGTACWRYRVPEQRFETSVDVHEISGDGDEPHYLVLGRSVLSEGFEKFFRDKTALANRMTTLGAMVDADGPLVAATFALEPRTLNVCTALFAIHLVSSAESIIGAFSRAADPNATPPAVQALSAWSDVDFEQLAYDFAHLGCGTRVPGGFRLEAPQFSVDLRAIHDNPAWSGGLLVRTRVSKEWLGVEGAPPVDAMNLVEVTGWDVPAFGAWTLDDGHATHVMFVPNFAKGFPGLTQQLVTWAHARARLAPRLAATARSDAAGESATA